MTHTTHLPSGSFTLSGRARLIGLALVTLLGMLPALARAANVSVPASTQIGNGATVSVPVSVDVADGIEACDIDLTFTAGMLAVSGNVASGSLTGNCTFVGNSSTPGLIRVAMGCV